MSMSKTYFWITIAICMNVGFCEDFYKQTGESVIMNCGNEASNVDIEWKHNKDLIIRKNGKSGRQTKGSVKVVQKAKLNGNKLEIPLISTDDFGDYTCNSVNHKLYVASAFVSPSSVLISEETKLSCDIKGHTAVFEWKRPSGSLYGTNKDVTLTSVSSDDAGRWECQIKAHKTVMTLTVNLTVVGFLKTTENITVPPGSDVTLPCVLPNLGTLSVMEAEWTHDRSTYPLLKATRTNDLKWNSTYDLKSWFTFSDKPLSNVFNVTMRKVKDAGVYVCTLLFNSGKKLSAKINLKVEGERVPDNEVKSGPQTKWNLMEPLLGVEMWIWIAVGAASLLLIGLVVVIVLVYRRNKRIKKQIIKTKLKQQCLELHTYCQCDRPVSKPKAGKRMRPPPLPRQHYNALTE